MGIEPVKGNAVILLGHLLQSGENIVKSVDSMSMSSLHTSTAVEQAPWSEAICNTLSWLPGISSTDGSLGKSPKVREDKPISKPSISSSENLKHCLLEDEWGPVQSAATKWLAHLLGIGAISAIAKLGCSRVTSDRTAFMKAHTAEFRHDLHPCYHGHFTSLSGMSGWGGLETRGDKCDHSLEAVEICAYIFLSPIFSLGPS